MAEAQKVDEQMPLSAKESKWFGHYNADPCYNNTPNSYYWPTQPAENYQYQVPFNLLKSNYEVWPMMQQGQDTYVMPQHQPQPYYPTPSFSSVSKCVSSIWGFGSAAISAMASTFHLYESGNSSGPTPGLNPNAKAFKPVASLNPNAKEFKPASSASQVPEEQQPVTPPNGEVALKTVAQRKCTPWIPPKQVVNLESKPNHDLNEEESENDEDQEDIDDDDYDSATPPRTRLLSLCSSEDGFITFEDSPSSPKVMSKIDSDKCSKFLKDFINGNDSEDSDTDSEESDDGDWDTTETFEAIFLDDDEELKKFGLHSQWHVPHHIISNTMLAPASDEVDHGQKRKIDREHPHNLDYEEMLQRVQEANAKWDSQHQMDSIKDKTTTVVFSQPLVTVVHEEDPELAAELRLARVGENYAQRQADQARYNRLLEPIFKPEHRDKMRSYIESYLTTS